jgi:hypothetical protein
MKHFLATISTLLLLAFTTDWNTVKINETIEVSMPGQPIDEIKNGTTFKKLTMGDSTKFNSGAIDLTKLGLTEEQVKEIAPSQEFKDQFKQGLSSQGITVLKEEYGEYKGNTYYELLVERTLNNKKSLSVMRAIFYKQYMIQLSYIPGLKGEDIEIKNKIFTSLKLS